MEVMLRYESNLIDCVDAKGKTPLHYAAANTNTYEVVMMLLAKGADALARDFEGNTPRSIALASYIMMTKTQVLPTYVGAMHRILALLTAENPDTDSLTVASTEASVVVCSPSGVPFPH
jgi:hypothetical protein